MSAADVRSPLGLEFEGVDKRFGNMFALRQLSLEVAAEEFVALLGPNGAGKTTLLRVAALLAMPTAGKVRFTGAPADPSAIKRRIGMVSHSTFLYDELTARENLEFFAKLYGLGKISQKITSALDAAGLGERSAGFVRTFSRGMRQRLSIVRALLPSPTLLLLDEPTTGLDRGGAAWLAELLRELKLNGCTVIASMHTRNELLGLVTRAVSLRGGRIERDSGARGNAAETLAACMGVG